MDNSAHDLFSAPDPTVVVPTSNGQHPQPNPNPQPLNPTVADTLKGPAFSTMDRDNQLKMSESAQFNDMVDNRGLLESSMKLKPHEAQNYRKKAIWISWISILVTLILAIASFTVSIMRFSASSFGFAFDATLDVLSSAIVLWRYSNAAAVHSAHREYLACVILGVIFLLSALCIIGKAIHALATHVLPEVLLADVQKNAHYHIHHSSIKDSNRQNSI
ncbi:transmembrane protein 163 [Protopterus annectens]|uniref:transmembrane protein 163 n=1 Tax=Protopterus annectens TaxID=7888 RepID=UPI001CF9FD40|nr:transmembrane protein 163 [Protopterus annectens]